MASVILFARGIKKLRYGLTHQDSVEGSLAVVRGIRSFIIAVGLASIAAGMFFNTCWLIWFGVAFLLEELLETGIMVIALRSANK